MRVALGSDHRGGQTARRLIKDVFMRDHYALEANEKEEQDESIGAYLIENVSFSNSYDASSESDGAEDAKMKIYPIAYSKGDEEPRVYAPKENVDYPNVAAAVAEAVATGRADFGVLICGTGIGMCITANKFRGVRAALCYNEVAAELSRRHNDANILCLPGEYLSAVAAESIVRQWFASPFDGGRHKARIDKIAAIEEKTRL